MVHPTLHEALLWLPGLSGVLRPGLRDLPLERLGADVAGPQERGLLADLEDVRHAPNSTSPAGNANPKTPNMMGISFMIACCCWDDALGGLAFFIWRCW